MGLLSCVCPNRDDYEICDERGHDYREDVESEFDFKMNTHKLGRLRKDYEVSDKVSVIESKYGDMYSYLRIYEVSLSVCRDCGEEKENREDRKSLVLCEDGEYRPFNDLFEQKENDEEDNA